MKRTQDKVAARIIMTAMLALCAPVAVAQTSPPKEEPPLAAEDIAPDSVRPPAPFPPRAPQKGAKKGSAKEFVGHYYLSGILEVGSELLLKPDGRFQWIMMYGSVDQFLEGRWEHKGGAITLTADPRPKISEYYKLGAWEPWNVMAERVWLDRVKERKAAEVRRICPFTQGYIVDPSIVAPALDPLHVTSPAAAPPSPLSEEKSAATKARDASELEASERAERATRIRFEDVARSAITDHAAALARGDDAIHPHDREAESAYRAWSDARDTYEVAHRKVHARNPERIHPIWPAACAQPEDQISSDDPASWHPVPALRFVVEIPHLAKMGGEYAQRSIGRDNPVTLHYADGRNVDRTVDRYGIMLFDPGEPLPVAVTLNLLEREGIPPKRIALPALKPAVQTVVTVYDSEGLRAFETLTLRIEDDGLIPEWGERGERGIYRKGN